MEGGEEEEQCGTKTQIRSDEGQGAGAYCSRSDLGSLQISRPGGKVFINASTQLREKKDCC